MHSQVGGWILAREVCGFLEPRTRYENGRRGEEAFLQTRHNAFILIVAHAEVVGIDDQRSRVGLVAEAFSRRDFFFVVRHLNPVRQIYRPDRERKRAAFWAALSRSAD